MLFKEIWTDIEWYEWKYMVSNYWNVKSITKWVVTPKKRKWYNAIELWKDWKSKMFSIHRLVALNFLNNPENKGCVNHKDGIKDNNYIENIERVTHSENLRHAYKELWKRTNLKTWKDNELSIPVLQYAKDWKLIKERESMGRASKWTWISTTQIYKVCKRQKHYVSAWWFVWKYKTS